MPIEKTTVGIVQRHDNWTDLTATASLGRSSLAAIPHYQLLRAATRCEATPAARLLLVHLVGYLGQDRPDRGESRFVVYPGNQRLADELRCATRSVQRQADELEKLGLVRRCYNGLNRRTGFDLAPLAVRHGDINSEIVAIHTRRKDERNEAQLELTLEARVSRPGPDATWVSPRGDTHVTLNGTPVSESPVADGAAAIDLAISEHEDRTGDRMLLDVPSSISLLTGSGRTPNVAWRNASADLGDRRAAFLLEVARRDPTRRTTTERYFAWLVRMARSVSGASAVTAAAARALKAPETIRSAAAPADPRQRSIGDLLRLPTAAVHVDVPQTAPSPLLPVEDRSRVDALKAAVGIASWRLWIGDDVSIADDRIVVRGRTPFQMSWIEANLADSVASACALCIGRPLPLRFE